MLNTNWGATDNGFLYGDTCDHIEDINKKPIISKERSNIDKCPINGTKIYYKTISSEYYKELFRLNQVSGSVFKQHIKKEINFKKEIRRLRDRLNLSQNGLSLILGISESTIQKIERGGTKDPSAQIKGRIEALIDLREYLSTVIGNKKYAIIAILNTPLSALGNISAKDYLSKNNDRDSILDVLAVFQRMYR